ncbi:basic blue protein-like [Lolium perenne]|uniref:basic blue protein-like n=1 Tax=Lolium perenne TaxID=4522 RepID=UPI0021F69C55|nr:basic blue protein-like [Lolium perenne]
MAAAMKITLLALAAIAVLSTASAATYNVGEPASEWGFGINYGSWASSKQFIPGDSIVFKYNPQAHDVLEVSKADYDSCSAANPITTLKTGNDVIALPATGTRYFICGFTGHCASGMKVTIDVLSASSPLTPSSPAPASGPSASNSPPPPPPSAATSVRVTAGLGLVLLLAGLMA